MSLESLVLGYAIGAAVCVILLGFMARQLDEPRYGRMAFAVLFWPVALPIISVLAVSMRER